MDEVLRFPVEQKKELEEWLKAQFIEFKPGAGSYQLIRIKTLKKGFRGIYQSPVNKDEYLVDGELNSTIRAFFARRGPISKE